MQIPPQFKNVFKTGKKKFNIRKHAKDQYSNRKKYQPHESSKGPL